MSLHNAPRRPTVIWDMDGTLANASGQLNEWAARLFYSLWHTGHEFVLVTSSTETSRGTTLDWLCLNLHGFHRYELSDRLLMAPEKNSDKRDSDVKRDLYAEHIKPYRPVVCVISNWRHAVRMWRDLGLTCLQCGDGE